MSLLLWEYFWTEADWVPAPPSVSAADVVVPTMFGSKGHDYHPLPDDFWEARERYIRRFIVPVLQQTQTAETSTQEQELRQAARVITKATIAQAKLRSLHTERNLLLEQLRLVRTREEFQRHAARILQISLDILNANNQYYEQAAIILLLDLF